MEQARGDAAELWTPSRVLNPVQTMISVRAGHGFGQDRSARQHQFLQVRRHDRQRVLEVHRHVLLAHLAPLLQRSVAAI